MDKYYTLDANHQPVETDLHGWGRMLDDRKGRTVGVDEVNGLRVSTVFLGMNHNYDADGPPLLFETMVFGGEDEPMWRYSTWDEAQAGHQRVVDALRAGRQLEW